MAPTQPSYFFALAFQGVIADRPTASTVPQDSLYWATDTTTLSISDGSSWNNVGGGGGSAVTSVFTRTGAVVAVDGDYYGVVAAATTGNTAASRYVGATASGHPTTGAHLLGDFVIDQTGAIWVCTTAGTPGTWTQVGGGGGTWPTYTGSGSPVGSVSAAAVGDVYADTTNGAMWIASATGTGGWATVGGQVAGFWPGVILDTETGYGWGVYDSTVNRRGFFVDSAFDGGTPSPIVSTFNNILDDGNSGNASFAGQVSAPTLNTSPPASSASTLALGTAYQNTLGYDILVTVYLVVTANISGVIQLGVDNNPTPTQQTIITGTTLTGVWPIPILIPNNYYALLSSSGTITVTISGQNAMAI